jgi:hypothetical protein
LLCVSATPRGLIFRSRFDPRYRPNTAHDAIDFKDMRVDVATGCLAFGHDHFGPGDGRIHAGDVRLHFGQQGSHFGAPRPRGVAIAKRRPWLRCASAFAKASADKSPWQARLRCMWRARFSNIIVIRLSADRRGTPSPFAPPDAPPHRFDEKRGRLG